MSDSTYIDTLERIEALKKEAEDHKRKELGPVVERFKKAIEVYGIRPTDVFTAEQLAPVSGNAGKGAAKPHSGARPPKYTDGKGDTWSGYGRKPKWFIEATARGQAPESMLIKAGAPTAQAAQPAPAAAPAAPAPAVKTRGRGAKLMKQERAKRETKAAAPSVSIPKGAVKKAGKGKIAYRLGEKSWTGVGPRPGWFKEALAQGRSLEDLRA